MFRVKTFLSLDVLYGFTGFSENYVQVFLLKITIIDEYANRELESNLVFYMPNKEMEMVRRIENRHDYEGINYSKNKRKIIADNNKNTNCIDM